MWKFLRTEMLVILALTEDASRTDAEIAELYELKKGTVSSVRRRLLDAGAINFVYVPAFNRLGCEMLGFHYGSIDPAVRADTKASNYLDFINHSPQVYFGLTGGNSVALFTALRNATELESFVLSHNKFFLGQKRPSRARLTSVVFPYSLSKGTYVPQFATLVHNYFELDVPPPKKHPLFRAMKGPVDFSKTEKAVLINMVENPTSSDREIAETVKLSRQAVTRIRNRLIEDGILTKMCIPRLYRWGFEICALGHPKFSLDIPWEKRLRTEPKRVVDESFFFVSKADEAIACYMVSKFSEYSERLENILEWFYRSNVLERDIDVVLFSLERSTELRNFDYAPSVKHLLGQDIGVRESRLRANV